MGLSAGHDTAVIRGDPASRSFWLMYLKADRVIALDCVDRVRDYVQGRALVIEGVAIEPSRLADAKVELKAFVVDTTSRLWAEVSLVDDRAPSIRMHRPVGS